KPQQQQGTVPQADQPVPGGGEHGAQLVDGQRGGLLHPPPAGGPVTAVGTQRQPGGGGVDRQVHGAVVGLNGADDALDGGRGGGLDLDEVDDVVGQGGPGGRQGPAMVCRAPGGEVLPVVGEGPPGVGRPPVGHALGRGRGERVLVDLAGLGGQVRGCRFDVGHTGPFGVSG